MTKLLLLVAVTLANLAMVVAQSKHCGASYLTPKPDGTNEAPNDVTIGCKAATIKTDCAGGRNARCTLSLRTRQYICCFEVAATVSTPAPGATFATPAITPYTQNQKPLCPKGALAWGGNGALTCNITNPAGGCPTPIYSCVKAYNVYDFYGTPAVAADDSGAALNPNVCCHTDSLTSYAAVFTTVGLTPNVVPTSVVPTSGIVSLYLPTPAANVFQGDDRSLMPTPQLSALADAKITLFSKTVKATALDRYHVLFFDAYTNKDCLFVGNLVGSETTVLTVSAGVAAATPTTEKVGATVYTEDTTSPLASKPYKYTPTYNTPATKAIFGPANKEAHRFVLLVWKTPKILDFGPASAIKADTTKILLGTGNFSDFVPTTDTTAASKGPGKFTTVTAFLTGKAASILGKPIAGSYFYFMA